MSDSNRFGPISKTDQTAIAPVEDGATASKAYAIGSHFMRDGQYCTAIAAIAQGASFTLNTNYTVGDVEYYINSLLSEIKSLKSRVASLESRTAIDGSGYFPVTVSDGSTYFKLSDMYFRKSDNTVRFASNGVWHKFTVTNA